MRVFAKRDDAKQVTPTKDQTLAAIVAAEATSDPELTWQEVALYNWATTEPAEVNRALVEIVGVSKIESDPTRSVLDPDLGTTKIIYIPKPFEAKNLDLEKKHVVKVKQRRPAPAVGLTELDKWFIPESETCNIKYRLDGSSKLADKVDFEVYAANYCKATPVVEGNFVKFTYAAHDEPIQQQRSLAQTATRREHPVANWKGESTASDGILKPRAPAKAYINVACSPYTVLLRYYKQNSDKDVKITLEPFWPRWDKLVGGSLVDDSLVIKWKIEGDTGSKLKLGHIVIWDKTGDPVFQVGLDEAALKSGSYDWKAKGKTIVTEGNLPYRVQIQAHSLPEEDNGLAVAVAHTEVRLWVHKDTGKKADPVAKEKNSLKLNIAPWRPETAAPAAGDVEWYKLKLAESGFHPGPVNADDGTDEASTGFDEFNTAREEWVEAKEVKRRVDRLVDYATRAKAAVRDARADVVTAKNNQTTSATDAGTAKTRAEAAATAAETAEASVQQALADIKSAVSAHRSFFVRSATAAARLVTARASANTALVDVTAARDAAEQARTAADTAVASTATANTSTAAAFVSAGDQKNKAIKKLDVAIDIADWAKKKADAVPSPAAVRTAVDNAKNSGDTAKNLADTSFDHVTRLRQRSQHSVTASTTAQTSCLQAYNSWRVLRDHINNAKTAIDTANFTVGKGLLRQASAAVGTFKARSDAAVTATTTFKDKADRSKNQADAAEFSATQARDQADDFKDKADTAQVRADAEHTTKKNAMDGKASDMGTATVTSPFYVALAEFQRSFPKNNAAPYERLVANGKPNADTRAAVARLTGGERPMFGNPTNHADYTVDQSKPLFLDKTKDLIVWAEDRHCYTQGGDPGDAMSMLDYRGPMSIGDERVDRDKWSIPRPWIPTDVQLPLLSQSNQLQADGNPPAVTAQMRRAIGPIRVDWTFDDLPPEIDNIPATTDAQDTAAKATHQSAKDVDTKASDTFQKVNTAYNAARTARDHANTAKGGVDVLATAVTTARQEARALANAATQAVAGGNGAATSSLALVNRTTSRSAAKTAAQTAYDRAVALQQALADLKTARDDVANLLPLIQTAATETRDEAADAKAAGKVLEARNKANELKTEADGVPSPAPIRNAVDTAFNACVAAVAAANTARDRTATVKTNLDQAKTNRYDPIATAVTLAETTITAAVAAAEISLRSAGPRRRSSRASALVEANTSRDRIRDAGIAINALRDLFNTLKTTIDAVATAAGQARTAAGTSFTRLDTCWDRTVDAWRLTEEEKKRLAGPAFDQDYHRSRKYLDEVLGDGGKGTIDGTLKSNCPAVVGGINYGGIRPDPIDDYYKAPFSIDKDTSLRPWLAFDDSANKVVCSVVHSDLGQAAAKLYDARVGMAGNYLRPSRIAGDGYRFKAEVSFKAMPGDANLSLPNRATLESRYQQLPHAYSAGLRVWRKTSFRSYLGWMPAAVAGWQATMDEVREFYKHAHVYFIHEGPNRNAHQQFTPVHANPANGLVTPAEFQACVDAKLDVPGSAYEGKNANYTAGYIWPYLNLAHYGVRPRPGDLKSFRSWLYGTIEETSWDMYSKELILLLIKKIEVKNKRLRGHIMAEFSSSPAVVFFEYTCDNNACKDKLCDIVSNQAGVNTNVKGNNYRITERLQGHVCRKGCGGHYGKTDQDVVDHMPLCAIGRPLGGSWLYVPRNSETWAHEIGHHRHLQHAQANRGSDKPAPGAANAQHDSQANPHQAGAPKDHQKAWDRFCIMSYDKGAPRRFCGKCILRNRGWAVESIANPAGATQDH